MTHPLHSAMGLSSHAGFIHSAPAMIWAAEPGLGCTYFNEHRLAFTGLGFEAESGFGWVDAVYPDDRDGCLAVYEKALAAHEPFQVEYRLRRHDGVYRWVLDTGVPQQDAGGSFAGLVGSTVETHDRHLLEEQLYQRVRHQSALAEIATDALEQGDTGRFMELVVRRVAATLDADACHILHLQSDLVSFLVRAGARRHESDYETVAAHPVADTLASLVVSAGDVLAVADIRSDRRFKRAHALAGEPYVSALGAVVGKGSHPYGALVASCTRVREYTATERDFLRSAARLVFDHLIRRSVEVKVGVPDGSGRASPESGLSETYGAGGFLDQAAGDGIEIVEALRQNEINWRILVEQNPDPIFISAGGQILYVNQAGVKLIGAATRSELIGEDIFRFSPPSIHDIGRDRLSAIEQRGETTAPMESILLRLDGTERFVESFSTPTVYEGRKAAQTVMRDVTERRMGSEALRQSEERFSKAFQAAPVAMVITRLGSGRVVDANDSFARMTGYVRTEVVGRKAASIGLSVHRVLRDHVADILEEGVTYQDVEVQILAKSGAVRDVLSSGEFIEIGGESCLLSMFYDITERKRLEREVLEIAEAERRRIGQDLHDGLGQQLTGIAFLSRIMERNIQDVSPDHADQMSRIVDLITQAINYTRNLSRMLSPVDIAAEGLCEALKRLALSTSEFSEVECRLDLAEDISVSNNTAATHLYRITQEAINNALKHASPHKIDIELVSQEGHGILRIRDDGKGIARKVDTDVIGMGMRTMRYRSNVIGGALEIRPRKGGGTVVECRFPLGSAESASSYTQQV